MASVAVTDRLNTSEKNPALKNNEQAPRTGVKTGGPKTAGGTLIKTPWRAQQHAEIQALLASIPNNITCICEICDCGQCVHNHKCKRVKEGLKSDQPFPSTHTHDMFQGVYQPPRSSKKPPPTPRETDIPPMVFDTNQRDEFIPRQITMRKPLSPPKPNFERPTAPIDGVSYYMQEFLPKKLSTPSNVVNAKHKDMIRTRADAKFYGNTTNMEFYKQWQQVPSKKVAELPCYTGELLYPDKEKLPQSTTQQAYPGVYAPRPEQIKAAADNLHVGGTADFTTTTQEIYKGTFGPRAQKFIPAQKAIMQKGPLMAQTQSMSDYPYKQTERVKPIEPLQPTIDLRYDNKRSFDTEQRAIYQGHDPSKHPIPKSFKRTPVHYERPSVPVEGVTVTHAVFTPKNLAESYVPLKPAPQGQLVRSLPKFDGTTMNNEFYKNWGNKMPRRLKHIDFADVYHPPEGRFHGTTTTKETFSTPLAKCLQHLDCILTSIGTMEDMLDMSQISIVSDESVLEPQMVERISTEFNQLQYYVSKCRDLPLITQVKPRINRITQMLQKSLEGMFIEGLGSCNEEVLTRCLRTYITIDKISDAETLFMRTQVHPYMVEYICESYIKQKGGSFAMYSKILEFKQAKCSTLLAVLKAKSGQESLKGYDFMVNSVWPEIVELLESRASSIFAPGNPDKFYKEYLDGMEFLSNFELQCGSKQSVERLRKHPSYDRFLVKWNLLVYFQMRFQGIAGTLEKSYNTPWSTCEQPSPYKMELTSTTFAAIERCWTSKIFLKSLTHRFWKLTLQILSRYSTWLKQIEDGQVEIETKYERPPNRPSSRLDSLKSDDRSSPNSRPESPVVSIETRKPDVNELVMVLEDSFILLENITHFYDSDITPLVLPEVLSLMKSSLDDGLNETKCQLNLLSSLVTERLVQAIMPLLKQVSDIPRLYRRTNKEVPTKPSSHCQQACQQLVSFHEDKGQLLPKEVIENIMNETVSNLLSQYEEITREVLLSVKKMEDSLKRLKRGKTVTNLVGNMTDDDKIRTQIALDVAHFTKQMMTLGVQIESLESCQKLKSEVEQALPNQENKEEA